MGMTDTSSSIGRFAGLTRGTLLGIIQSGIGDWTGRIWFPSRYYHRSELAVSVVSNHRRSPHSDLGTDV